MSLLILVTLLALAIALPYGWWRWRLMARQNSLRRLLDLADAMESLLDRSQERMSALHGLVNRVPNDIAAVALSSLESTPPIRDAKRDVLQHRLWIKQHGANASLQELDTACAALQRARDRLAQQLDELETAGSALARATDAANEAARREPATLRRKPEH
jgi:DNA repair ATPase RecN